MLFRNQILMDLLSSIKHQIKMILSDCSNNLKGVGIPMVRSINISLIFITIEFYNINLCLTILLGYFILSIRVSI